MKKSSIILSVAVLATLGLGISGCAVKTGNETLGKMEKSQLEQGIVKGKSTKEDVKAMLGDPDKTDFDNNSLEKWSYVHVRMDAKAVNYIPVVNWFVAGTNNTTKTLIVVFDDKGIVKNYINSDAKGETKGGLFQ
ncbi:MAG: outer membrane protein assembly factor BamE [Sulfurimonas sp.]|jgi:outer membrane protein assembly factor BamE (lipoprotein component of BamABCDE complex)